MRLINQHVRPATSPTFKPTARLDGGVRYLNWLGGLSWSGLPVPGGWRCQAGSCGQLVAVLPAREPGLGLSLPPGGQDRRVDVPGGGVAAAVERADVQLPEGVELTGDRQSESAADDLRGLPGTTQRRADQRSGRGAAHGGEMTGECL